MVAITHIVLLAGSVAAAVMRRDAATVMSDLEKIDSDTNALTSAVNNWNGLLFTATPIMNAESTLDSDIKSATTDADNSAVVSDADASMIIDYINNTLEPDIASAVSALEAKKSDFQSSGLTSTVQNDLKTLKSDTDTLGQALVSKAPADMQSAAMAALAKIDNDFAGAEADFS